MNREYKTNENKGEVRRCVDLAFIFICFVFSIHFIASAQSTEYQTAVTLVQEGKFDQAFPILQKILEHSPNDLRARNLMGIALSAAGRRDEANEQFKKVLAIEPKFIPALKNIAI